MINRLNIFSLMAICVFFINACASKTQIDSRTYKALDWSNIHTFAWSPDSELANQEIAGADIKAIASVIERNIETQLKSRNIRLTQDPENADIIITYLGASIHRIGIQEEAQVYEESATLGTSSELPDISREDKLVDYNEGAIIIVASDPATGDDIWQGRAYKHIKAKMGENKRNSEIKGVVEEIFARFPKQ